MANPNPRTDQLEPYQFQSGNEASKAGAKGGIASGKARRKKSSLLQCAKSVLMADIPPDLAKKLKPKIGNIDDENDTMFTVAVAVALNRAISGDIKAFHEIKDLVFAIEDNVYVDETIEDDAFSVALERRAQGLDDAD